MKFVNSKLSPQLRSAINNHLWQRNQEDKIYTLPSINVEFDKNLIVKTLLDSGSSLNLISEKLFNRLRELKLTSGLERTQVSCVSAQNVKINVLGKTLVKIKINNFSWKVKFLVVKNLLQQAIIGANFMKNTGMILDLKNNQCEFNFKKGHMINLNVNYIVSDLCANINIKVGVDSMKGEINQLVKAYPSVFTNKIGKALNFKYKLKLKDDTPVYSRPYPLNPIKLLKMREIIQDLMEQDIIEPSISQYSSPAFLVGKENGQGDRLVINYKKLNDKLEGVSYPLSELDEIYPFLRGNKYFSTIDLSSAFHQIELEEGSRELTTFCVPFGSYRYKRIPFGLLVGSGVLTAYLNQVLGDLKYKCTLAFLDDIIVYSKTQEEHLEHLRQVLNRLRDNNLTVKAEKVKFCFEEIKFLGHLISKDQLKIDPDRTVVMQECPRPKDKKGVSRFIGMASYFSKFIPNYAELAVPLNDLRKKSAVFVWSNREEESFQKLKDAVSRPPVLAIPDYTKPFVLQTDASDRALGSVLLQRNEEGDLKPVAYYSRKFSESEERLTTYQKETLSVVCSFNKFRKFLEIQKFELVTDNSALAWVLSHFKSVNKLGRWAEVILSMPFNIQRVRGANNPVADFLSRLFGKEDEVDGKVLENMSTHVKNSEGTVKVADKQETTVKKNKKGRNGVIQEEVECNNLFATPCSFVDILSHQKQDNYCRQIWDSIKGGTNSLCYFIKKGVIMYKGSVNSKQCILLPKVLFPAIYEYYHTLQEIGCHSGVNRTIKKICEWFYHPELQNYIKEQVGRCEVCLKSKGKYQTSGGELHSGVSRRIMERMYIDAYGPLPRTKEGYKYVLIAMDDLSKFVWLLPLRDITSGNVIKALDNYIFNQFSLPEVIVSDNATCFTSEQFKEHYFSKGVQLKTIIPYTPQGNKSERVLRNLNQILIAYYAESKRGWSNGLGNIQLSLNCTYNESIKSTAFEMLFNFKPNFSLNLKWNFKELFETKDKANSQLKVKEALKNLKLQHDKNSKMNKYKRTVLLNKGDIVFCRCQFQRKKLDAPFDGPYKIVAIISDVSYLVQDVKNPDVYKRVHIRDIKKKC